jgi:hypothetical protein
MQPENACPIMAAAGCPKVEAAAAIQHSAAIAAPCARPSAASRSLLRADRRVSIQRHRCLRAGQRRHLHHQGRAAIPFPSLAARCAPSVHVLCDVCWRVSAGRRKLQKIRAANSPAKPWILPDDLCRVASTMPHFVLQLPLPHVTAPAIFQQHSIQHHRRPPRG